MKITVIIIFAILLAAGTVRCQVQDSTASQEQENDIPVWLKEKIKEMSLDEKRYTGTKVFKYEIDSVDVYSINNPWSSCMYCDLYYTDGSRLNQEEIKTFIKEKDEPVLIWENYPAVPFDSLKKNIEKQLRE